MKGRGYIGWSRLCLRFPIDRRGGYQGCRRPVTIPGILKEKTVMPKETDWFGLFMNNVGEAISKVGTLHNQGKMPGADYNEAKLALMRSIAAIGGTVFAPPPVDTQHIGKAK